jgi:hypothetical protein
MYSYCWWIFLELAGLINAPNLANIRDSRVHVTDI